MTQRSTHSFPFDLLTALLLVAVAVGVAFGMGIPEDARRMSQTFGPFLTEYGGGYTVAMDYAKLPPGSPAVAHAPAVSTLNKITVVNGAGQPVYERAFTFRASDVGFDPEQIGTAYEVRAESGTAVVLEAYHVKSGQVPVNATGWMIALVKEGKDLRPAAPEIRFHGQIEHFPGPPLGPRQLVPGDLMRTREWTGHYSFIRSFRADFRSPAISATCVQECTFPAIAQPQPLVGGKTCRLHKRPLGSAETVALQSNSKVEYLDAFVRDAARYDRTSDDLARRPWLHVRVDGHEGWVTYEADLAALGLPYAP